ncbi:MAG: phosphotransferase [Fimbriimonas sp.]
MARPWDADVEIDVQFADARIVAQFPEFSGETLTQIGQGYDNAAYLIGERTVFRLPRRAAASPLLQNEARILPLLAPHLPLPVPAPSHFGKPDDAFPYPFVGYPFLPGTTACHFNWTDDLRAATAADLGRFFRALHAVPITPETRTWAPGDEIRRTDLRYRLDMMRGRATPDLQPAVDLAETLVHTPPSERMVWVHGDIHPRHLLVDPQGKPSGVIDWGDVHLGDPALDLSIAFTFLPPRARPAFRDAYGEVEDAAWDRARFRAAFYAVVLVEYGRAVGDGGMERAGIDAMRFATERRDD